MKLLLAVILSVVVTCHFAGVDSTGKAPIIPNDQSDAAEQQEKPLGLNDVEKDGEPSFRSKRIFGKVVRKIKKVKEKLKHKVTLKMIQDLLRKLGVYDNKDLKVFTASSKLIKRLLKSKDNTIDTYKPPSPPCSQADEESPINNEDGQENAGMSDQESTSDEKEQNADDSNNKDSNDGEMGEKSEIKNVEADADAIEQEQDDDEDLKTFYEALSQQDEGASKQNDNPVEKRSGLTDLCREIHSKTFVLLHPDFKMAYEIPNVHCPVKQCFSSALRLNLGRCAKKKKRMTVFVFTGKKPTILDFKHKTVTVGCACECLFHKAFA